jgi:purine-nucleoside phosphorylase
MVERIQEAADFLRHQCGELPKVGVILGTGLGNSFVRSIESPVDIPYDKIPHFPLSTVESHRGRLTFGNIGAARVVVMQGRFHYYEGYSLQQVTFPVRVMRALGVQNLLISNAAGNLNREWKKGDLMLLQDHINFQSENPLRGKNLDLLGPRFPDMSEPYHATLSTLLRQIAAEQKIALREGVYVCVNGPNLETRAEYRFLQRIGGDAVGMSTVPEVIVANHMSLPCCAISVLTDDCDPDNLKSVDISEIIAVAQQAEPALTSLFLSLIQRI